MDVTGTSGNDQLYGTIGDDRLFGLDGSDVLLGGTGDDLLVGGEDGSQNDSDQLYGDIGNDSLVGAAGEDYLDAGAGDDDLSGGSGNDRLYPGTGRNVVQGGDGDDEVFVQGSDTVDAGAGNDLVTIRPRSFMMAVSVGGNDGDDRIGVQWTDQGADAAIVLAGGGGRDTFAVSYVDVSPQTAMPVAFAISDFSPGTDQVDLIPLISSDLNGNPFGSLGLFRLQQRGADAVIQLDRDGAAGTAFGWEDAITLVGIDSADLDKASFVGYLDPAGAATGAVATGTEGADVLRGGPLNDSFSGGGGADVIGGAGGDDFISGGDETDWEGDDIGGGAGNDTVLGGAGNDSIYGREGNDSLEGGTGEDSIEGNAGNDFLSGGDGDDDLYDTGGDDTFLGGAGNDWLYGAGSSQASYFDGGDGHDSISPGFGADTVFAGAGNDYIGVGLNSTIYSPIPAGQTLVDGGADDDTFYFMYNGAVTAIATGGAGIDTFHPTEFADSMFEITDFAPGLGGDIIDFSAWNVEWYRFQVNPFGQAGYARAVLDGADTVLELDRDGAAATEHGFEHLIRLRGVLPSELTVENFGGASSRTAPPGMSIGGSADADVLTGGGSADTLDGLGGNDRLDGGADNDRLFGGIGDDILLGGRGSDMLDGGTGRDQAIFDGNFADFNVSLTSVADQRGNGTDTLAGIERLVFADTHYALDISGVGGQAYRLYQAAFNRTPDLAGLGYWIGAGDRGLALVDMSAMFFLSPEFDALYGASQTNEELVRLFYVNALHRQPDEPGVAYWTDLLDRGMATPATILTGFSESDENKAATAEVIGDGFKFDPTFY